MCGIRDLLEWINEYIDKYNSLHICMDICIHIYKIPGTHISGGNLKIFFLCVRTGEKNKSGKYPFSLLQGTFTLLIAKVLLQDFSTLNA